MTEFESKGSIHLQGEAARRWAEKIRREKAQVDTYYAIGIIDELLGHHGTVIVEEAEKAGLELPLACALVEQESGGANVFGADHPEAAEYPTEPPYYRVRVTSERVQGLLFHIERYGYGASNGTGIVQLTYPPLIREAEAMGGAHRPRYQCRVGFRLLKQYIDEYGTRRGIGAYNGGAANPNMAYAWSVLEKRNEWRRRLG
jgi:hypothetical protein